MADRIDEIVGYLNKAKEIGGNVMDYLPGKFPTTFGVNPMTSGDEKMARIMKTTPQQLQSTRKGMGISDTDPSVLMGGSMNIVNKARSAASKVGGFFKAAEREKPLTQKGFGIEQPSNLRPTAEVNARMAERKVAQQTSRPAPPEIGINTKGKNWTEIQKEADDARIALRDVGKYPIKEGIAGVTKVANAGRTGIFPYLAGGAAAGLGAGLIDRAINPNAGIFEDVAVKPETAPTGSTGQQAGQTGSTTKNQGIGETPTAPAQTTPEQQAEEEKIPYNYNETTTDRNRMADDLRMAGLSAEDAELVRQGKEDQITNAQSYGLAKRALAAKEYETQVPKTGYMTRDEAIAEGITAPEAPVAPVGPVSKYGTPETMYGDVRPAAGNKALFEGGGGSRATRYYPIVDKLAGGDKFLSNLSKAMIQVESGGNPNAVSEDGAFGLTQFMPATAKKYGVIKGNSPQAIESQIRGNQAYINDLRKKYGDDPVAIASAYHAGETNYDKNKLGPKNRNHVQKVMSVLRSMVSVPSVEAAELPQPQRGAGVQRDVNEMVKYNRPLEGPLGGPTGIVRQPEALPETPAPVAPAKKYGIFDAMDRAAANVDVLKGGIWTQKGGRKMTTAEQTEQQIEKAVQRGDIAEAKVLSDTLQNMAQGRNYSSEAAIREALLPFQEGKSKAEIAKMDAETKVLLEAIKDIDMKDIRSVFNTVVKNAPKVDVYENGEKVGQRVDMVPAVQFMQALIESGTAPAGLQRFLESQTATNSNRVKLPSGKWATINAEGKLIPE